MGYSGDDCDTCEDLRREIADLQATVEHKKKECLELIARGDRFFEGQQRVVAQRDALLAEVLQGFNAFDWDAVGRALAKAKA